MEELLIIIPVHEYNDTVRDLLTRALESAYVSGKKICISCPKDIKDEIIKNHKEPLAICTDAKETSFQALVNSAVKFAQKNKYKWFSVLEFDDAFSPYWFSEVETYYKANPDVSVFLPLTHLIKFEDGNEKPTFYGYGNEAPWASAFSNEIGFVDFEVLSNYFDFYLTGSIINVDDFISAGSLKKSMKLVFWYEFLLRLTNKEKKVYVVPKVGYTHTVDRKDSLFDIYKTTLDKKEIEWWYELAKQECYFAKDRNKQYNKEEEEEE